MRHSELTQEGITWAQENKTLQNRYYTDELQRVQSEVTSMIKYSSMSDRCSEWSSVSKKKEKEIYSVKNYKAQTSATESVNIIF